MLCPNCFKALSNKGNFFLCTDCNYVITPRSLRKLISSYYIDNTKGKFLVYYICEDCLEPCYLITDSTASGQQFRANARKCPIDGTNANWKISPSSVQTGKGD